MNDLSLLEEVPEETAPQTTPEPQRELKTPEPSVESPIREEQTPPQPSIEDHPPFPVEEDEIGVELVQAEPDEQDAHSGQEEEEVVGKVGDNWDAAQVDSILAEEEQDEKMDIDEEQVEAVVRQVSVVCLMSEERRNAENALKNMSNVRSCLSALMNKYERSEIDFSAFSPINHCPLQLVIV